MGNYATTADLIARYESSEDLAHLTDSVDDGAASTAVLNEVLNNAEGEIDSYIAERYAVPVDVSSDTVLAARLKSQTLDIACWNLCVRGDIASEVKETAYNNAIAWLEKIASGKNTLPAAEAPTATAVDTPTASWGTAGEAVSGVSQRKFSRASQEYL